MKLASAILLLTSLTCPILFAAENVDQQTAVDAGSKVDIKVQRGHVDVSTWDKNEIAIKGTLDEKSEGLVFAQKGNTFVVEDKLPHNISGKGEQGSSLHILLPKKINLRIKGISADYQLKDIEGNVDMASISGNLTFNALNGDITARSVSGNIDAKDVTGKMSFESVSGDINDNGSSGTTRYRTVSGDLSSVTTATELYADLVSGKAKLALSSPDSLELHAVSGDISISLANVLSKAQLDSVSGDINLTFSATPDVEFSINGGPGGDIHNQLSTDKPVKAKYTGAENLKFQLGSGKADFYITTISGEITLKK